MVSSVSARLPLALRVGNRVNAAIGVLAGLCLELVWALLLLSVLIGAESLTIGTVLGLSFVLGGIALTTLFIWTMLRQIFLRGALLEVSHSGLRIHHPVLFRRDLLIRRDQIKAVSIDRSTDPGWWSPRHVTLVKENRRLQWVAGSDETLEALDELTRFMVPLVSHDPADIPNIAVLLFQPFDWLEVRRWGWLLRDIGRGRHSEKPGLLLRVVDPDEAARAFEAWGVLRKLDADDVPLIEPSNRDLSRAFWRRVLGYVFIGLVIVRILEPLIDWIF